MNYGFKAVEFFPGNVCAFKLDYFDSDLTYSGPVADAALGLLINCDAVIIDLRDNSGGSPATSEPASSRSETSGGRWAGTPTRCGGTP